MLSALLLVVARPHPRGALLLPTAPLLSRYSSSCSAGASGESSTTNKNSIDYDQPHSRTNVPIAFPSVCIWGANTGVGKTLVSAGLVAAAVRNKVPVQYIKPVQTGYPQDSDARLVATAAAAATNPTAANTYLLSSSTLFAYRDPVSPHLAAAAEQRVVPDSSIVTAVAAQLQQFTAELTQQQQQQQGLSVVETAGGVTSPGPSGTLQGDLLRPLGLPALLVGDPQLGGISTTLSAYESLLLRGARVAAIVMMADGRLNNIDAVAENLQHAATHRLGQHLPVLALPLCHPPSHKTTTSTPNNQQQQHSSSIDAELSAWLAASSSQFDELLRLLQQQHEQQLQWLCSAPGRASATVWWPFTQHAQLPNRDVTVVDARAGEDWLVFKQPTAAAQAAAAAADGSTAAATAATTAASAASLVPLHDAASSWWTQTAATAQQQLEVCRAVAAAAGRYMHVMWPQVVHAPGLSLTEALLHSPLAAGWGSRVFFSDDGSTAVEVALKMAFRKYLVDHGLTAELQQQQQQQQQSYVVLEVLALHNSYHGDTLGSMDCAAASAFNGPRQTPWYTGRGLFLDPPYLALVQGNWALRQPAWLQQQISGSSSGSSGSSSEGAWCWQSQAEVLDVGGRSSSRLAELYRQHIESAIDAHEAAAVAGSSSGSSGQQQRRLGALLIEPVLQGAGGMLLVDPLFQAELVKAARRRRISVIYDEVFTGCWRLGLPTAGQLLQQAPDIACYAKLLTGGVAPLAVTISSEAVFDAFKGDSKVEALLHGHSYTAYPVGCAAAMASLALLQTPALNPNLCTPDYPGRCQNAGSNGSSSSGGCSSSSVCKQPCGRLLPQWDESAAAALSQHPRVAGVVVLGSVLAVELQAAGKMAGNSAAGSSAGSYGSAAAVDVVTWLRERGVAARPLGPVVYMMATPTTTRETCGWLLQQLMEVLDQEEAVWAAAAAMRGSDEGVLI